MKNGNRALAFASAALVFGLMTTTPAQAGLSSWFSSSISRMKNDFNCFCNSRAPKNQYTTIRRNGKTIRVRVTDPRAPSNYWNGYSDDYDYNNCTRNCN